MSDTPIPDAYPELTELPETMYVGQIGDCYATVQTQEGPGLLVFLDADCHQRSTLSEELKGTDPIELTRAEVMQICDICYLVDPDKDVFVSFIIKDVPESEESDGS